MIGKGCFFAESSCIRSTPITYTDNTKEIYNIKTEENFQFKQQQQQQQQQPTAKGTKFTMIIVQFAVFSSPVAVIIYIKAYICFIKFKSRVNRRKLGDTESRLKIDAQDEKSAMIANKCYITKET